MISQKDIVVKLVKETLGSNYDANIPCFSKLTNLELRLIASDITNMILKKEVTYSKMNDISGPPSRDSISKYVKSMIKNHLVKAKELNGNYSIKSNTSIKVAQTPNAISKQKKKAEYVPECISQEFKDFVRLTYRVSI